MTTLSQGPSFVEGLLHCHRTTPRGLWGFMKKIHLQCLSTVACEYAPSAHMYIYISLHAHRYNMMCNYVILSFSHERICWCSIVIYILMLYYRSEWICWCFQNRWLNLSMAGLIGRYCAPSFELYLLFCFEASWCIWEVLWNKKRKSSPQKERKHKTDLTRPSFSFHLVEIATSRCRGMPELSRQYPHHGEIAEMQLVQCLDWKSAGGSRNWVTTRNNAHHENMPFMKNMLTFHHLSLTVSLFSFFLEALMIGFLWGFQDSYVTFQVWSYVEANESTINLGSR